MGSSKDILIDEADKYKEQYKKYRKGYLILMEYWDSLPDEEKEDVSLRLQKVGL